MVIKAETSGLYTDEFGTPFLFTQGVSGHTLVAGKRTLLRIFMPQTKLEQINSITGFASQHLLPHHLHYPIETITFEPNSPNGPNLRVKIDGRAFPVAAQYTLHLWFTNFQGERHNLIAFEAYFRPTKDLRILFVPLQGSSPSRNFLPTPDWYAAVDRAMVRLSSMYPVRDGVHRGLDHGQAGIRYDFTEPREAWPREVGLPEQDYLTETNRINSQGGNQYGDLVDVTVLYRPRQPQLNEDIGGNAPYCREPRWGECITEIYGNAVTASVFAQEIGHTFCLEPPTSPHDDGGHHSLDPDIFDRYAYDFIYWRYYVTAPGQGLGDTMSGAYRRGDDQCVLNSYDWEYLRDKLNGLNSTGTQINPAR
jgi:hypothetical protein